MFCLKVVLLLLLLFIPVKHYSQTVSERSNFTATAYCLSGITKKGHSVRRGIIAVDPKIIPLNSVVFINGPSNIRGYYLASDTGKVIKGSIIDIWMPTCREAIRWGRRKITVSVKPDLTRRIMPIVNKRNTDFTKVKIPLGPIKHTLR